MVWEGERRRPTFYGRRRGRRLRPGREALLAALLPRLAIPLPPEGDRLDPGALFNGGVSEVWLEIGFGAGEHLATQAVANPGIGFIGCEPYVNGVTSLLSRIEREGIGNIRVWADDSRPLLGVLAGASIGRAFILFPDPWPKARHHKRRIVSRSTLDALAFTLADGAELRLATDDSDYAAWMLARAAPHPSFQWLARSPRDWRQRPPDWPPTRYERKATAAGRESMYLRFRRRPR